MLIKRQKNNNMPRSIDKRILNIKTLNDLDLMSEVPYNRLKSINKTPLDQKYRIGIDKEINNFFKNVINIINKHQLDIADALNYVRETIIFKELSQIEQPLTQKSVIIERDHEDNIMNDDNIQFKYATKRQREKRQQDQFDQSALKNNLSNIINHKLDKFNNNIENIYNTAKIMNFNQFQKYYKQIHKTNGLQLFNIKQNNRPSRIKVGKEGYLNTKAKIMAEIILFFSYKYTQTQIKQLQIFLEKELNFQCKNPCCKWSQDKVTRQTSAFTIENQTHTKIKVKQQIQTIYKSDKVQQYYNRYYNTSFRVNNIKNLPTTNGQQIQKLYKQYMLKQKYANKIRSKAHFRSQTVK